MNYSDIKKYGNTVTIYGQTFLELFDDSSRDAYGLPFIKTEDEAREFTINEILRGNQSYEMYLGLNIIEKMKTRDYIEQDIESMKKALAENNGPLYRDEASTLM